MTRAELLARRGVSARLRRRRAPTMPIHALRVAAFTGCVLAGCHAAAQVPTDPAVLQQRLADKLAQPFLRLAAWHTDLAAAKQAAAASGKLLFVHCTRSFSPCGTSIRCEREVLGAPAFAAFAGDVVLYCHVTAHVDPAADRLLAAWRGSGWPHHVVLDATGRVLGTHESHRDKSVEAFRDLVARARQFLADDVADERAIAAIRARQLARGLDVGALTLADARRLFAAAGELPAEQAAQLAAHVTDLEIADVLTRYDRFDPAQQAKAGAEFHVMHRQGKRPHGRNAARDFWGGIVLRVESIDEPDLALHQEALAAFEQRFGSERGYQDFLAKRRQAFVDLQRKAGAPPTAR